MPLVKLLGGSTREDNTEIIRLNPHEETGEERLLYRGGEVVEVSGDELRALASNYEVQVVEPEETAGDDQGEPSAGVGDGADDTGASSPPSRPSATDPESPPAPPPGASTVSQPPAPSGASQTESQGSGLSQSELSGGS